MGSGGSAQALQLTPQEAADVGTFVATGLSGVPSLKKKLEDLQAGAQESEKLRQKVVQLEEEILALRQAKESGAMQGSECRLQKAHSTKFQKITASIDAIFNQFASGPCGIGAEHLSLAMRFLGLSPTQDEVQQCLDKMGCPNHLEHAKFHDLMQEELDKHFAKVQVQEFAGFLRGFDLEGKGSLSVKDFQEAMGGSISDEKLRALLQRVPRTGQGDLEFIELAKCFQEPGESLEVDQTAEDGGDKKVFVALLSGKDCECFWSQDRTIRQLKEEAQQKLDIKIKNLIGPSMEVLDEERMLEEESIVPGTTLTVVAVDHAAEDKEEAARCQDIFAAAVLGKLGATRHFLRMDPGAACKTENCSHSTALHLAAHHGHVAICEVLLAARAEVDAMCLGRWSPLHSAAQNGQADAVKLLLEAKASVTRNEEGKTPLDLARRRGKTEVMRILEGSNLLVLALAGGLGYIGVHREDAWYRFTTTLTAVAEIARMPEEKLNRFLLSYRMFEKDQFTGEAGELDLLTDYYSVLNHLCAIGNFEKMYLPPYLDENKDVYGNQKLYEKKMADFLDIGPGSKVADIGCGRGRVAHHVSSYTGAHVTGLNIDKEQIRQAVDYAKQTGLGSQLDFKVANYNDPLPFPNNSLDAAYYVQVLSYSTNLEAFFKEVFRVVKPGGRVAFEDYVLGTNYSASNPHHMELKNLYKPVLGGVETSLPDTFKAAVEAAGFQVVYHKDDSIFGRQAPLLRQEKDFWLPLTSIVGFLHSIGLVPEIYFKVMQRMTAGTDALIESDELGIVSCGYVTFAVKPKEIEMNSAIYRAD